MKLKIYNATPVTTDPIAQERYISICILDSEFKDNLNDIEDMNIDAIFEEHGFDYRLDEYISENYNSKVYPLYSKYSEQERIIKLTIYEVNSSYEQIGYILVSNDDVMNIISNMPEIIKQNRIAVDRMVETIVEVEVSKFQHFMNGEVYGVQIFNDGGELFKECSGFYGSDFLNNGVFEFVKHELKHLALFNDQVWELIQDAEMV